MYGTTKATPGEEWDYDAVQQLILGELPIEGATRKVLMQANKNGFFYVLDRQDREADLRPELHAGELGKRYRSQYRPAGRESRYPLRQDRQSPFSMLPGALGAHSWQAMAFNPKTGLVYIPAQEIGMIYDPVKDFRRAAIGWNIGTATTFKADVKGYLIAWDPVRKKEVWRANYLGPWNSGILLGSGA